MIFKPSPHVYPLFPLEENEKMPYKRFINGELVKRSKVVMQKNAGIQAIFENTGPGFLRDDGKT